MIFRSMISLLKVVELVELGVVPVLGTFFYSLDLLLVKLTIQLVLAAAGSLVEGATASLCGSNSSPVADEA